jgi:alpha-ketoglutarate-dependent taurine dioxygenase
MTLIKNDVVVGAEKLPMTITLANGSPDEFVAWYKENKSYVDEKITNIGAVHFQGIHVNSVEKFGEVMKAIRPDAPSYLDGNSSRSKYSGNVYNASEYDENSVVQLHTEFSYSNLWPDQIHFCCVKPADVGGQTTVAETRLVLEKLDPKIVEEFERKGILYIRNHHGGKGLGPSWMEAFETSDKKFLEEYCKRNEIETKWMPDGSLRVSQFRPALRVHPKTGAKIWFNQVDQFYPAIYGDEIYQTLLMMVHNDTSRLPMYSTYGDGSPIQKEYIEEIIKVLDEITVPVPWKVGDILMVDNMTALHGRLPFKGDRKILASMSNY